MNNRIKKKHWMQDKDVRMARSELILNNVIYAYSYATVCGKMSKGYIRWRYYSLKAMNFRKRDCSIWKQHMASRYNNIK